MTFVFSCSNCCDRFRMFGNLSDDYLLWNCLLTQVSSLFSPPYKLESYLIFHKEIDGIHTQCSDFRLWANLRKTINAVAADREGVQLFC